MIPPFDMFHCFGDVASTERRSNMMVVGHKLSGTKEPENRTSALSTLTPCEVCRISLVKYFFVTAYYTYAVL
jgi:hypothetical protein